MPWRLWRYIFADLARLAAISTAGMLTVLSLGGAVVPVSQGYLALTDVVRLIGLLAVVTLPYALPFSACLGTSLVVVRLVQDHELDACAASGVGHRALLMPFLLLACITGGIVYFSANQLVPAFAQRANQLMVPGLTQMLRRRVRDRESFRFNDTVLFAEDAENLPLSPPVDAENAGPVPLSAIQLSRVVLGRFDRQHRLSYDCTAASAELAVYWLDDRPYLTIRLNDALVHEYDPTQPDQSHVPFATYGAGTLDLPAVLMQSGSVRPRFLSTRQLRRLEEEPDRDPEVDRLRHALLRVLTREVVLDSIFDALERHAGADPLRLIDPSGRIFRLSAAGARETQERFELASDAAQPIVAWTEQGGPDAVRIEAREASLSVHDSGVDDEARLDLELHDARLTTAGDPSKVHGQVQLRMPGLRLAHTTGAVGERRGSAALLTVAAGDNEPTVRSAAAALAQRIATLRKAMVGERMQRVALSGVAGLTVLVAALMAMLLRGSQALVVFVACFLPIVVSVMLVEGGRGIADALHFTGTGALPVMLAGPLVMVVLIVTLYARLRRH